MGAFPRREYHVKCTLLPQFSNNELLQYGGVMSEIAILMVGRSLLLLCFFLLLEAISWKAHYKIPKYKFWKCDALNCLNESRLSISVLDTLLPDIARPRFSPTFSYLDLFDHNFGSTAYFYAANN